MGQHLVDLIALALGPNPDAGELLQQRGKPQARLALMKADIMAALGSSDLNIGSIARRYHLSQRQAQRLFEQNGNTFTDFLFDSDCCLPASFYWILRTTVGRSARSRTHRDSRICPTSTVAFGAGLE
jgi:AraC-like DNA-binding protein